MRLFLLSALHRDRDTISVKARVQHANDPISLLPLLKLRDKKSFWHSGLNLERRTESRCFPSHLGRRHLLHLLSVLRLL